MNMVSEPKAHITKSKAVKRQKEKGDTDGGQQMLGGGGGGQPLLAYYMSGLGPGQTAMTTAKRPRVEEGDSNNESEK